MKSNESPQSNGGSQPREHWKFLDGIRGLAALMVVVHHIRQESVEGLSSTVAALTYGFHYGHEAVCVFIVLSGFCLMLPVTRSLSNSNPEKRGVLSGGLSQFVSRRAWRILPPFYAALAFSLTLNFFSADVVKALLQRRFGSLDWHAIFPGFTWDTILPHALLIHNFWPASQEKMPNYPLWSVALEWQIYFVFALLLLPIWRKWGAAWTTVVAFALSLPPMFFLRESLFLWLLGFFAMGMFASDLAYHAKWGGKSWNNEQTMGRAATGFLVTGLIAETLTEGLMLKVGSMSITTRWFSDILLGIGTAALIVYLIHALRAGKNPIIHQIFVSRVALFLGAMSYSLYLTHKIILVKTIGISEKVFDKFIPNLSPDMFLIYNVLSQVPIAIALAYLFYLAFEKPFVVRKARQAKSAAPIPTAAIATSEA